MSYSSVDSDATLHRIKEIIATLGLVTVIYNLAEAIKDQNVFKTDHDTIQGNMTRHNLG